MKSLKLSRLKECRESKQWTQETLAELAGVSVKIIQRTENGAPVNLATANAIALAMDVHDIKRLMASEMNESGQVTDDVKLSKNNNFDIVFNLFGFVVLMPLVFQFIIEFSDTLIKIGYAGVVAILILIVTKENKPGVSWFKSLEVRQPLAQIVGILFLIYSFTQLYQHLLNAMEKPILKHSMNVAVTQARDISMALDERLKRLQENEASIKMLDDQNFNSWLKDNPVYLEKFEKITQILKEQSGALPESCRSLTIGENTSLVLASKALGSFAIDCEIKETD